MQLGDKPEKSSFFREKCKRTRLFRQGQGALRPLKTRYKKQERSGVTLDGKATKQK